MDTRELITLEKAMLAYANLGRIRDKRSEYPYFMKEYNCIHIREFLVKGGFLKLATYDQSVPYYPYRELQLLLKQKGVSVGNSKNKVIENSRKYLKESDLEEYFDYRCYIPTDLGKSMYNKDIEYHFVDLQLEKLRVIDKRSYIFYTQKDKIKEVYIALENKGNKSYIKTESNDILTLCGYNKCKEKSDIKLFCEDTFICEIEEVDEIYFFEEEKQVLFVTIVVENKSYICKKYDIILKQFVSSYKFAESPWNYINRYGLNSLCDLNEEEFISENKQELFERRVAIEKMLEEQKGIYDADGSIIYYFSIDDAIAEIVVENYIGNIANVSIMKPMFEGDFSKKYKVKIFDKDKEIEHLILWMFKTNKISQPKVSGIPISSFCNESVELNAIKRYNNYEFVKDKLGFQSWDSMKIIVELNKFFPAKVLVDTDYYKSYRGVFWSSNRKDYYYVCEHFNEFSIKYKDLSLELKEKGLIPTKWINEFNLYMLVKAHYKDAIYQYHANWLGRQSLDVFIPCKNLGIEYQGIQHYEAIDLFGGEKGYIDTQKRDQIKKNKCREQGVQLLYWDYRMEINENNLIKLFYTVGITIPIER